MILFYNIIIQKVGVVYHTKAKNFNCNKFRKIAKTTKILQKLKIVKCKNTDFIGVFIKFN